MLRMSPRHPPSPFGTLARVGRTESTAQLTSGNFEFARVAKTLEPHFRESRLNRALLVRLEPPVDLPPPPTKLPMLSTGLAGLELCSLSCSQGFAIDSDSASSIGRSPWRLNAKPNCTSLHRGVIRISGLVLNTLHEHLILRSRLVTGISWCKQEKHIHLGDVRAQQQ